ncbi:uncharacterized protein LOC105636375 [Jatropha curcas]|uniref:uncharacterized protein LOC105636375 n=1 Tax=Jatropha curcas TaxID=180498 RepID=UPI0009D68F37|nr:uncharacterized protein LOC105636375 [Jatropha curcas]
MEVKAVLRLYARWQLISDSSVNVWHDPWLSMDSSFYVFSLIVSGFEDLTMADLKDQTGEWNEMLVLGFFFQKARTIFSIPLYFDRGLDRWVWHWTSNGHYSIQSGYHLCVQQSLPPVTYPSGSLWKPIWPLKISAKMAIFIWRACRDVLLTSARLGARGVAISSSCPFCHEVETPCHVIFDSSNAKLCWQYDGKLAMDCCLP